MAGTARTRCRARRTSPPRRERLPIPRPGLRHENPGHAGVDQLGLEEEWARTAALLRGSRQDPLCRAVYICERLRRSRHPPALRSAVRQGTRRERAMEVGAARSGSMVWLIGPALTDVRLPREFTSAYVTAYPNSSGGSGSGSTGLRHVTTRALQRSCLRPDARLGECHATRMFEVRCIDACSRFRPRRGRSTHTQSSGLPGVRYQAHIFSAFW